MANELVITARLLLLIISCHPALDAGTRGEGKELFTTACYTPND